ncbi:MAG: SDR family oxidoreductase [Pseudomonadota bacterium]
MVEIGDIDYTDFKVEDTANYACLKDRVVIITGGGQGLGRGYAHYFAAQGAIPIIATRNNAAGEKVASEIHDNDWQALSIQTDVADEKSVATLVDKTLAAFGRIDCLINNAAVFSKITMAPFWELPIDEWRAAVDVNITGSFLCARAVVPAMQAARWGRIINVSSATFLMGLPNYLHYITTKSAMVGMTRSMAKELGEWGVTVNTFWPGVMQTEVERPSVPRERFKEYTERQAIKRQGTIHDLAKTVLFLCSEDASYITGQSVQADGGLTFV